MGSSQQFSLRWNNYLKHITCAFDTLRTDEDLVDVTLSCEGKRIRAHKMLLSACSTYFRDLFKENPCQHPVIIFRNVKFDDLAALVDFMYQGEVNVVQEQLASFLTTAELLAVQGLTDGTGKDDSLVEDDLEIPNEPEVQLQNTSGKSTGDNKRNKSPSSPMPYHAVELQPEVPPNKRRKIRESTNVNAEKNSAGMNAKDCDGKTSENQTGSASDPVEIIPLMPNLKLEMPEYLEQDGSSCSYEDQSIGDGTLNKITIDDTSSTTPDHEQKPDISQTFYSSQSTSDGLDGKHQSDVGHLLSKPSTSGERATQDAVQVRRTRSGGRTRKTAVKDSVAKKSSVKKRSPRKVHESEKVVEEETTSKKLEEGMMESMPENGVQRLADVIVEQRNTLEEDTPMLHLELEDFEDTHESNVNQEGKEIEQDEEDTWNSKSEGIIMGDTSMDKVEMLAEREVESRNIEMEGQDVSNDDLNQQRVLIDFQEVINEDGSTMTQEILEAEEVDSEDMSAHTVTRNQVMENDEGEEMSQQEISEDVETLMGKVEEPDMEELHRHRQSDSLPRTEITEPEAENQVVQEYINDEEEEKDTKKPEPDTEAVSEDELPTEAAAKEPETEAVSDEELPVAAPADLGETESVSEDELPPDSDKKKKSAAKLNKTPEKKTKAEAGTKRKLNAEGEYDPSSPTSENNDEAPAKKVALSSDAEVGDKQEIKPASPKKKTLPELEKYWKAVNEDPSDFTGWTYLLQYVDQENDAEAAREAYTKFLERYPYCYGYWRKFADYEKKKGNPENVQTVFDQGLKAISLSVDLWLHYINHCKTVYEKDEEKLREQYERAIQACGLEFRSDRLWESYIKWESEAKRLSRVTALYDRLLSTPTLGYTSHFEAFQEFVSSNLPNRILSVDDFLELRAEVKALLKSDDATAASAADDAPPGEEPPPHEVPPTDEETRAIREKIISSRRKMHKANVNAVAARWSYEEGIKRPYFHVKPLERCQLKNWKEYLDFEIEQKDQNRIIILFERCLIACALYDEFWMRFVRYLESLKGDNTEKIRDVYSRACMVHHPKKPNLHLQWAIFEEGQDNFEKAAAILENIDNVLPNMLQVAYRRINLERRRGDLEKACTLYENYISNSKNRTIANNIAVKYARFLCKVKDDVERAIKVLMKATDKDKDNPRLYLQLIDLAMQRTPVDTQEIVGYMDMFIEREHADLEQRVLFAQRKVEFLEDFSPDIRQVLKAHEQFQKCIKQAKERKKTKSDDNKTDSSPPKKKADQSNVPPSPSVGSQSSYQYSSGPSGPYQSPQQFQGGQYGGQGGYQQGYQQYPPPSDPNYANYQNWQYGQGGPQAYGPYNQWGSYNYY